MASWPFLPSSWRTTLLVYLIVNLKSLPFAWHIRILYHFIRNVSRTPIPPKQLALKTTNNDSDPATGSNHSSNRKILTHPLFAPTQITTHTPLLETDYNMHKSNSTYLSDMDVSRTQLLTRLCSPGLRKVSIQLEKEGYKGRILIVLGAVHVTFKREIGIYERVAVRSRVLSWDDKWLVVVSYFVRPKKGTRGKDVKAGEEEQVEEVCAMGLSKYVIKKGRFTVRPGKVFAMGGWMPKRPEEDEDRSGSEQSNDEWGPPSVSGEEIKDSAGDSGQEGAGDGLASANVPRLVEKMVLDEDSAAVVAITSEACRTNWEAEAWSWDEVEEERLRGLDLAKAWLALDGELFAEFGQT
jgi:acyl-CoA thioesterase FadM